MALLAVAAAVCLSVPAGGVGVMIGAGERRVTTDADEAVASFMACLNEAAKTLAGQTAAVTGPAGAPLTLPTVSVLSRWQLAAPPVVTLRLHLSRLNLPPPTPLS